MSLLTIVQGAAVRCNLAQPNAAFSSTDPQIQQIIAFAQDTGRELMERGGWRNLKFETSIVGDGSKTLFSLPSDFKRLCPSDKPQQSPFVSMQRPSIPIRGPVNDEWLNAAKALPVFPAFPVWRLVGTYLEMWPAVPSAEEIKFWYFSKSWLAAAGVTTNRIAAWASDSDTSLIEEDTIMKGAIWRYKKAKGLDYAEEFREYELSFVRNLGQEGTGRVVQTASMFNWPPDFWPGMITAPTP